MSDQDSRLVFERALEHLLEDLFTNVGIKCRYRIIHHNDVGIGVDGARQTDTCLLTTRQVDAFLTDFSLVTTWENGEIALQLASG